MTTDPQTLAKKLRYCVEGAFGAYFQPEVAEQVEKQFAGILKGCERHGSILGHNGIEKQLRDHTWNKVMPSKKVAEIAKGEFHGAIENK